MHACILVGFSGCCLELHTITCVPPGDEDPQEAVSDPNDYNLLNQNDFSFVRAP
jgi:hypothetical protein